MSTEKTRFQGDRELSGVEAKAKAEERRADAAVRAMSAMKRRINEFFNQVATVEFKGTADTAPRWTEDWYEYLLSGSVPESVAEEADDERASPVSD